jgi:DNA polymerase (family 10)
MIATELSTATFREAHEHVAVHAHRTPLLTSRTLSEATGYDVRLKAESFQRTGSYKIRGPLNKFARLTEEEKRAGVVCSSAGNHAQGVALAAALHCHSTWSDGKHTLEQMARAARERGYDYLAITDHPRGTLGDQDVEVDALNERLAPLRILKGIEVNIRIDGSLSLPDEVLAKRDWVMASLHGAFDRNPTERVLAAMDNPHVDCIGHLTARKINIRGPSEVDVEKVVEKAADTGTFLEINSQPNRLDLRDAHARLAGEAGVKIVVNTDAHELRALAHIEMGVGQARRAWLTKEQVLNTRPWPAIQKLLK